MRARRRRGLLLLAVALAAGGLAASQVRQREQDVQARVGPLVEVLVAARDIPADGRVPARAIEVERVPARYVAPGSLGSGADLAGARAAVPIAAGSYLTAAHFAGAGPAAGQDRSLGRGERSVDVGVTGTSGLGQAGAGARVDVVVSTEASGSDGAGGHSFVALADVELLALRDAGMASPYGSGGETADEAAAADNAVATLRVTLRQAVYLTAADNFGREIRLLVRPPGDRSRTSADVSAAEL